MLRANFPAITRTFNRPTVLALALLTATLITTFAVYFPGLTGPLLLDDMPQLNSLIEHSADDPRVLLGNHIISSSGPFGRPVAMATFIGDAIGHGPDIWWWKYTNVLLHLIGGLLVFWLTSLLINALTDADHHRATIVAAVTAALWLLHPLHLSTVLYTVQRMTELSSLFVLAGLICYVNGRQIQQTTAGRGWFTIGLGFGVFFPLAVLSKENALLFPVYCSLIELFIFQFGGAANVKRKIQVFHGALLSVYVLVAVYVLANFSSIVLDSYAMRDFTFSERVLTQLRVMVLYLSQLLVPVQGRMGFFHDDLTLSTSLFNPITTMFSALVLAALIASAILLRKRLPLYAFGILFFFACHLLESTIFALELAFEHRNYLASYGIALAAVAIIPAVTKDRQGLIILTVIMLGGFSFLSWQRAQTWSSPVQMYEFMYNAHPNSPRLNLTFSNVYTKMGDYAKARDALSKTHYGVGADVHNLFLDCLENGKVEDAAIQTILRRPNGRVDGHVTSSFEVLAQRVLDGQCSVPREAFLSLIEHVLSMPARGWLDRRAILITKARVLESAGQVDGALATLRAAHELRPDNAMLLYFSAHMLTRAGRLDEAKQLLSTAYELEKTSRLQHKDLAEQIYLNVGKLYVAQEEFEKALQVYVEAIQSVTSQPLFHLEKAAVLIQLGRYEDAKRTLNNMRTVAAQDMRQHEYAVGKLEKRLQQLMTGLSNTP